MDSYLERVLQVIGNAPVNEVEVDTEGRWRPAGSSEPYRDIHEEPGERGLGGDAAEGSTPVKDEAVAGCSSYLQMDGDSDEEEEDEHEELRRTAAELKQASKGSGSSGAAAAVEAALGAGATDSDVIVISDSDSDDEAAAPPASKRPRGPEVRGRAAVGGVRRLDVMSTQLQGLSQALPS